MSAASKSPVKPRPKTFSEEEKQPAVAEKLMDADYHATEWQIDTETRLIPSTETKQCEKIVLRHGYRVVNHERVLLVQDLIKLMDPTFRGSTVEFLRRRGIKPMNSPWVCTSNCPNPMQALTIMGFFTLFRTISDTSKDDELFKAKKSPRNTNIFLMLKSKLSRYPEKRDEIV